MRGTLALLSKEDSNKIIYIKLKNMFKTDPWQMRACSGYTAHLWHARTAGRSFMEDDVQDFHKGKKKTSRILKGFYPLTMTQQETAPRTRYWQVNSTEKMERSRRRIAGLQCYPASLIKATQTDAQINK